MSVWRPIKQPRAGFLNDLSNSIADLENMVPNVLSAHDKSCMWLASDYSGQHKDAPFEAYSFLVTTEGSLAGWDRKRQAFRDRYLPDGRRLSFKAARESVRWRALKPFLRLANGLQGNLFIFVVDSQFQSLFRDSGKTTWSDIPKIFPRGTSTHVVEQTLRIGMFISLIIAGLRDEKQKAIWISDQDEALEAYDRRERLGVFVSYMTWGMTGWKNPATMEFGTTALDSPDRRFEDLAAIPDLAAGAMAHFAPAVPIPPVPGEGVQVIKREMCADPRTRLILDWLGMDKGTLRRILLRVVKDETGAMRARAECIRNLLVL